MTHTMHRDVCLFLVKAMFEFATDQYVQRKKRDTQIEDSMRMAATNSSISRDASMLTFFGIQQTVVLRWNMPRVDYTTF